MPTNYDPIAALYQLSKQQPWRTHIEAFTFLELIGDPTGKSVLDVACGEGFYTRMIRQRGAARVTGVDLSTGMIELARKQEADHQLGIDYQIGDACNLAISREFDLVIAAYLLNYARDRGELRAMCNGIARTLKPGGRFITVNTNPAMHFPTAPSFRKYGIEATSTGEWREGSPIQWKFYLGDNTFEIENYHLDRAAHEEALLAAGFQNIHWHGPRLSSQGEAEFGPEFWSLLMTQCPVTFLECTR